MANPFDEFDDVQPQSNPFDEFDAPQSKPQVAQRKPRTLDEIKAQYRAARKMGAEPGVLSKLADDYVAAEQEQGGFGLALDDTVRGLARGVGLNAVDEISATLNTLGGGDYQENLDYQRARDRYFDTNAPGLSTALQLGGGVAGALAVGPSVGLGMAPTLGGNVLRSGITGGALGGTAGFLGGENGVGNRASSGVLGAMIGAPLGAAAPIVASGLSGTGRLLQSRVLPGTVNAENRAGEVIGQAVARSRPQATPMTPAQSLGQMQSSGITNATLADLSDELTSLTGAVSRAPGRGRQIVGDFLRSRQEGNPVLGRAGGGQWADIFDDITQLVSRSTSAKRAAEILVDRRSQQAKPLYDKAFQVGNIISDELRSLGNIPSMRSALQRGVNMAKQDGQLPSTYKLDLDGPLPVQVWHQAKTAIDDLIKSAMNNGERAQARSLLTMQNRLLQELDATTNGLYTAARDNFAGNSAVLNALEQGKKILSREVSAEDIADMVKQFSSQSEILAFKAGAAQSMRDTVGRVGRTGNAAAKFLNRGDIQEKLQSLFDDPQDYQAFMERMTGRSRQYRTYAELTGSPTAARKIAEEDLTASIEGGVPAENILNAAITGGRSGVVRTLLQRLQEGPVRLLNERTREKLAEMLTTNDPQQIARVMQVINAAYQRAQNSAARNAAIRTGVIQSGVVQPATSQ